MIKARKIRLFEKIFNFYNTRLIKKFFYKIYLDNSSAFGNRNQNLPTIIFANHSNWWDGLIAFFLSNSIWNIDAYIMMDIEQLAKHNFFSRLGAFSVDKSSSFSSYKAIEYSVELLKDTQKVLWIFPQGKMLPNDTRPLIFHSGLSRIIEKTGEVNLFSLSFRYEYLMQQRPEIFLKLRPFEIKNNGNAKQLTNVLSDELTNSLEILKSDILISSTSSYMTILSGKKSIDKRNK
ncbi:MAG: lysophospholipid acyltransferase family protein [Ignavibacteria bacterium]|jgi:chlorobactene lauroyltransferase|nr:lysophospholipid acyltransferase family protein [Ignavibacteria bacterium]